MTEPKKEDKSYIPVIVLFIAFIAIFFIWLYWGSNLVWWTATYWRNKLANDGPPDPTLTIAELGQIGDLFGGVNSLFASFAFIGVAFAAYYQRKTYLQQLKDSEDNKQALAASNMTNAALLTNAIHELFIGVFLRMVEELRKTAENIGLTDAELQKIEIDLSEISSKLDATPWDLDRVKNATEEVERYYNTILESKHKTLRPFNKTFFQTFSLIQESEMSYADQDKYAQIAMSSIDDKLWMLIMMHGMTEKAGRLQEVIEKYGLLEIFPTNPSAAKVQDLAKWLYVDSAFQSPEERELIYDSENAYEKRSKRFYDSLVARNLRARRRMEVMEEMEEKQKATK